VTVIPTVIDTEEYRARRYEKTSASGRVRIGWSGSDQSIQATLVPHLPMLTALQARTDFELVVITNSQPQLPVSNLRWSFHPWTASGEGTLESKFDIGIMPLVDDEFQKGKCALKLLQYMAAGLPTVASPVGVNKDVVLPGVTGMQARTPEEWHQSLECLIRNDGLRASMGEAGRRVCEQHYSVQRWLPVLLEIFQRVQRETCKTSPRN